MFPVLKTDGTLQSLGLGTLSDAISCEVEEERNGVYELTLEYPQGGIHASDIALNAIIVAKPNFTDDPQPFRIYSITKEISGKIEVHAQHISYDLGGVIVSPTALTGATCKQAGDYLVSGTSFTFKTDKTNSADFKVDVPSSARSWLGGKGGSLLDVYGTGEYHFDGFDIEFNLHRGTDRGVQLRYGKNLTELTSEADCTNLASSVVCYYEDDGAVTIGTPVSTGLTGINRELAVDVSGDYDSAPSVATLTARASTYIADHNLTVPKTNITLDFVQASKLKDRVDLCDTVSIYYDALDVSATAKCIRTVWDVLAERYTETEFGDAKTNFSDTIIEVEKVAAEAVTKTMMEQAVDDATDFIKHGEGNMRFIYNASDELKEIVSLDDPDITQALSVWRWNNGGFGHSSTGYNGPYTLAITQNGAIVADFITAGTLNANVIRAGILQDVLGKNSWNLDTGEFNVEALDTFGGRNYFWALDKGIHSEVTLTRVSVTYDEANNGKYVVTCTEANNNACQVAIPTGIIPVPSELIGETITLHADSMVASSTNDPRVMLVIADSGGNQIGSVHTISAGSLSNSFTVPAGAASFRPIIRVRNTGATSLGEAVTVSGIKLEKGTVKTDWSPAPEDAVNGGNIISKINVSSEGITIAANKLNLTGYITATNLSTSGQTTINGANITTGIIKDAQNKNSWNLNTGALTITDGEIVVTHNRMFKYTDYSSSDLTAIVNIVNDGYWTDEQLEKYDFNLDGQITLADRVILNNMLTNSQDRTVSITTEIDPSKTDRPICIYDGNNTPVTYLSPNAVVSQSGSFGKRISVGDSRLTNTGFLALQGASAGIVCYDANGVQTTEYPADGLKYEAINLNGNFNTSSYDLNNATSNGLYQYSSAAANTPTSAGGMLMVLQYSSSYMHQVAFTNDGSTADELRIRGRRYVNGTWTNWHIINYT